MHTFFHGWRPKAGVITLVMACVVMIGWLRSIDKVEALCTPFCVLYSGAETVLLDRAYSNKWGWDRVEISPINVWWTSYRSFDWNESGIVIPYWAIAISLTLLSAYLILVPSRKRPATESQSHA